MIVSLLLLLAAPTHVMLMDEVVTVPPKEWRTLPVILKQQLGRVDAAFRVIHGSPTVRLAFLTREEAAELRKGPLHSEIAATPSSARASLSVPVRTLGEYELIVDNREGAAPVELHLTVSLTFGDIADLQVRYVSPQRRAAVIFASLAVFAAVAGFTGIKLRRAIDNRP